MPEQKKNNGTQEIGRGAGGLSTKIHALVDAFGNPTGFFLSPGHAHDLIGADALLADKAYASNPRVIDKHLYQARHLIENFFAHLKQYRAIATRYDKLARNFLGGTTWQLSWSGLIDDTPYFWSHFILLI